MSLRWNDWTRVVPTKLPADFNPIPRALRLSCPALRRGDRARVKVGAAEIEVVIDGVESSIIHLRHVGCSPNHRRIPMPKAARRELINTGADKRFVRRDQKGQFKESDDVGRSLAQDQKRSAKTKVKSGQGDKGDR